MTDFQQTKLFLAVCEQEAARADLHRALRRRAFTPAQAREKDCRLGRLLMRSDLLTEEIQKLQPSAE